MDSFSYLLQDIDPLLLDDMDYPINSCGKSNNYMKDLGLKNGENFEGTEFGFVSEFSSGYNHNFKKIESLTDSDNFKKQDSLVEDSLLRAKKTRVSTAARNHDSQIPVCQVQGCYKDLRSSKDYHKKHRVCTIHAKSAKVFVNGIEKRFCQQCSRFHVLKEFDDVKRSCRKRLAGHNERRRKPYIVPHIGAKEVEFPLPLHNGFAPSLLSFNSKKYSNYSKSPVLYDESALICSETERYYYKDRRFHEAGSALDLLHLSPHLQRVENLQNSVQVKQENTTFSCS